VLEVLTADDLFEILINPNNPIITGKKRDFRAYGINVKFEDQALRRLAEMAANEKTGARGLVSAVERVLLQFEKRLPSTTIKEFVVTPELVADPLAELARLLSQGDRADIQERFSQAYLKEREVLREAIRRREQELLKRYHLSLTDLRVEMLIDQYQRWDCDLKTAFEEIGRLYQQVRHFEERFLEEHQIHLSLDEDAVDEIFSQSFRENTSAFNVCQSYGKDLEHALKLVRERTSQDTFLLTREALINLEDYLNQVIRDYYKKTLFRE
jgi:hypothetical protein